MRDMHTIDYHLAVLEPLGISNVSRAVRLELPKSMRETADQLLSASNIRKDFIIFHSGSARAAKVWNAQRWAQEINHVAGNHNFDLAWTGGHLTGVAHALPRR